ncbi:MAG: 4-hydroxy-3-methylbut-2-en-1-yl diphosphate synthase [Candidatus Woykebacteria bacterium RBG_13_40_7b]|uniref:4-hydroxy-3-methylbut-2-en-1-yl diphosphate synthase (flavodoxin) n=1 Tax=Candidatus Woykebacteria bacterium RBG_13_40_7b TaxID=1802594 RepID=A0A1G1W6L6_9BACT|nr:MAG: 4-hydroxy-3-methylbut-2-en-1-yl diphosphate synthase [Candidatus Woykebacteria bacterium RBG_13_40_7b]
MIKRRQAKIVNIGGVKIGGHYPIAVQSMCNTDTRDVTATVRQIHALEDTGCEIVRVAVPDMQAAEAVSEIKKRIHIPLVVDIHFQYLLALECAKRGADKLRINPGNIGSVENTKTVVKEAKKRKIPIRIGINSGSIEKELLEKYGYPTPEAAVESALNHIKILESLDFDDIVVAIKFSDTGKMIEANRLLAKKITYPLHLGVTEAGPPKIGSIKSAIGIGSLLYDGIGDTIRVSLTGDSVEEVKVGFEILKDLGIRSHGPMLTSCPTCGRTEVDLVKLAGKVEDILKEVKKPIKVAVMGCAVNGPGEARESDIAVVGGKKMGAIFVKGKVVATLPEKELLQRLLKEIDKFEVKT